MVDDPGEPSQPIPGLQLAPALPCVPKLMGAKKLHLQIPSRILSKAGPFEQKMPGSWYKKICVRGANFGIPRARWVPRMGAGRSKREREILSPSASAEPIFPFHTLFAPPPHSRNLNINPAAPSGVRAHTRLFWRQPKSSNYR